MENEDYMTDYGKVAKATLRYALSCTEQEDYWWRMHWRNYFKMFQGAVGHLICEIYGRTFIVPENDQTAIKHLIGGNECFTHPIIDDETIKNELLSLDEITFDDPGISDNSVKTLQPWSIIREILLNLRIETIDI